MSYEKQFANHKSFGRNGVMCSTDKLFKNMANGDASSNQEDFLKALNTLEKNYMDQKVEKVLQPKPRYGGINHNFNNVSSVKPVYFQAGSQGDGHRDYPPRHDCSTKPAFRLFADKKPIPHPNLVKHQMKCLSNLHPRKVKDNIDMNVFEEKFEKSSGKIEQQEQFNGSALNKAIYQENNNFTDYEPCSNFVSSMNLHHKGNPERYLNDTRTFETEPAEMNIYQQHNCRKDNCDCYKPDETIIEENLFFNQSNTTKDSSTQDGQSVRSTTSTKRSRRSNDINRLNETKCEALSTICAGIEKVKLNETERNRKNNNEQTIEDKDTQTQQTLNTQRKSETVVKSDITEEMFKNYRGYHYTNIQQEVNRLVYLDDVHGKFSSRSSAL